MDPPTRFCKAANFSEWQPGNRRNQHISTSHRLMDVVIGD